MGKIISNGIEYTGLNISSEVVDNLESTDTKKALSANQGVVLNDKIEETANIAKGRNRAHVFSTTADMQAWLSDEANKGLYNVGDNLYIVDVDVPDWWISAVLDVADATGYYYNIAQLETQKVDLTNIEADIASLKTGKQDTITGAATTIASNNLTASRVLVSNASGKVAASGTTLTKLGYLNKVTSDIQTQIDGKLSSDCTSVVWSVNSSSWKTACVGSTYPLYLIEVVNSEHWVVNSSLHFWQSIQGQDHLHPVKIVDPNNTANYVQIANIEEGLGYITVGSTYIRIYGIK